MQIADKSHRRHTLIGATGELERIKYERFAADVPIEALLLGAAAADLQLMRPSCGFSILLPEDTPRSMFLNRLPGPAMMLESRVAMLSASRFLAFLRSSDI